MSLLLVDHVHVPNVAMVRFGGGADAVYFSEPLRIELAAVLRELVSLDAVTSVCLAGSAECFLLGADLASFRHAVEAGTPEAIVQFTRRAHAVLRQIAESPKPVASWVSGPAVGAGVEVALACSRIVATSSAKFSMPETGLGIYPGMGGTQRLPRRIGVGLAKWMIYTGAIVPAEQALAIDLVDAVQQSSTSPEQLVSQFDLSVPRSRPRQLSDRFAALERLFAEHSLAELLDPLFPAPAEPQSLRALVQLRARAPVALRLAEQIIDRGMSLSLEEGLELELSHLVDVFSTDDARLGILSAGQASPKFQGR